MSAIVSRYGYLAPSKMTETDCLARAEHYAALAKTTGREDFTEVAAAYTKMAQDARKHGTVAAWHFPHYLSFIRFGYTNFGFIQSGVGA
jgi:hypothetical protein